MQNKYFDLISSIQPDKRTQLNSVLIIDGLNAFLRAFTMINHINPDGHHIGALTGFLKSVGYAIKMLNPTKVVIVFDGVGGSNARRNLFPDYKANRNANRMTNYSIFQSKEEEAESINNQMQRLIQYLQCLPVTVISIEGLEADDIIGYLTHKFEKFEETKEINIMSADQDFLQLVTAKTSVYSPTKKKIYKPKDVFEQFGVSATNYINYKILLGDKSDNVPGVTGLGPVKLVKLFPELLNETLVSLEDIIDKAATKIDENKLYLSVVERRHQLYINKQLMNLEGDFLSPDNRLLVKQAFSDSYELNKYLFHQIYVNDKLGESIPNVDNWLTEVFASLDIYNKQ
jgi:DNA polymerase-1